MNNTKLYPYALEGMSTEAHNITHGGLAPDSLLNNTFDQSVPMEPKLALLNVKPNILMKHQFSLMLHILTAAIAKAWMSDALSSLQ